MNETETRAELIDPALKAAGWRVVAGSIVRREYKVSDGRLMGMGQRKPPQKADYVLQYKNRNIAVIEAKKASLPYTEGVGQAKDYAQKLHIRFAYSTNGKQHYFIDMHTGKEGEVATFHTPDELWQLFQQSQAAISPQSPFTAEQLLAAPFESKGGFWQPRYYQELAITKVIDAVAEGKKRILLTLATGTGKTAIAFQIAWKLFHAKWSLTPQHNRHPRILFLADRNILANQAFNSFSAFEEDALIRIKPHEIKKKGKVPTNGSIFFTIYQTFMSGEQGSPYFGEYPEDFFDFIIIDECHRGGANDESSWRAILEYFSPAVQLGLTATPKRDVNGDTYRYFGEPVYTYSLKDGINDGYLAPFKVVQISTTIDDYYYTEDDDVEEGEIDPNRHYTEHDFNTNIQIKEREEYRVRLFMQRINQNQKALVFCARQDHALLVRDLINQIADSKHPDYCHRVTANDGEIGERHLREFQNSERSIPTILTTSQKLSTGVDAPQVRNIILLRPIRSMVEFKQIIGRGTRLTDGKDHFTIYDFVNAYHHFNDEEWDGEPKEVVVKDTITDDTPPPPPLSPDGDNTGDGLPPEPKRMTKVKLADGKVRELQHMAKTSFWDADGKPISAEQFLSNLFGDIPSFFGSEDELRRIWSQPDTRKKLLEELAEKGYSKSQLKELQNIVHGNDSDLYDVLAYIAFKAPLMHRTARASLAKVHIESYDANQQAFLNFVLQQYIKAGVDELDSEKLPQLLELKYNAIADAKQKLGEVGNIRNMFINFQSHLYGNEAV